MRPSSLPRVRRPDGFTLIELLITTLVFAVIMAAISAILWSASHNKERTSQNLEATQTARATLDMIAKDLRSAGYGADLDYLTPQPAIAYVDSMQIILSENQVPYPDGGAGPSPPLAYDPAGSPNPYPLVSTQWTPPIRYRTGAELIRYTLDLNDDGRVDASDRATVAGSDAQATRNPNDYVLVREVYGDSTAGVTHNEGGAQDRVALVMKPGGSVPPMFTVYMKGLSTPWDWSNGPVPATQLPNIDRVVVKVTASSSKPDSRGSYPQATLSTEVNSMRNVPNSGPPEYAVAGYVFNDLDNNGTKSAGEPGIPNAIMQLGHTMIAYTNSSGYYQFRAPAGTYTLRQAPPPGYTWENPPDTVVVTITNSPVLHNFADIALDGGQVTINCFDDLNKDGIQDGGEPPLPNIKVTIGTATGYTDAYGNVTLFAATGTWSALATVPDSMATTTPNPVTGTIVNLGTASGSIGMVLTPKGFVSGTVFRDVNKNGVLDAGEAGIPGVWVGVTTDGGITVPGYALTDASGKYTIMVPANDPPRTQPYTVYFVPPSNNFPTTPTAIGGVYVQAAQTVSGYNFGVANYQVISLNANRVLSLASADLIENDADNKGKKSQLHGDIDIVLGADDSGGSDNISVWFNQYPNNPLFNSSPDYARLAPQSVLAMALDTLDATTPTARPDLVTGTKLTPSGNFFVWFNQNSSGNEGYFPSTYSPGQNYKTSDNGDVQAVRTMDVLGGPGVDIIVGTKSSTANQGQIEIWQSDDAISPSYTRAETYTTFGATSTIIGQVNAITLADLDNDGLKDMVVVTTTGQYSGQLLFYKNLGKLAVGNHFQFMNAVTFNTRAATAVAVTDVDQDGLKDVIVGTQDGATSGTLLYFRNKGAWNFGVQTRVAAPGIVLTLKAADMGGDPAINDLVVGWRGSTANFTGGVTIYFLDVLNLPSTGTDPSGGSIVNMVPAATAANFNYGTYPACPPPYLTDLAVGVKETATTGQLVIFIR